MCTVCIMYCEWYTSRQTVVCCYWLVSLPIRLAYCSNSAGHVLFPPQICHASEFISPTNRNYWTSMVTACLSSYFEWEDLIVIKEGFLYERVIHTLSNYLLNRCFWEWNAVYLKVHGVLLDFVWWGMNLRTLVQTQTVNNARFLAEFLVPECLVVCQNKWTCDLLCRWYRDQMQDMFRCQSSLSEQRFSTCIRAS